MAAATAPHPTGLSPGKNRILRRTMVAYTERMIAAWHDGEVRDIHLDMMRLALEIVAKALFNVEIAADRDRIAGALNTFMELGSRGRMLLPPILRLLPTADNLRYRRAARHLDDIVYGLIHQRRSNGQIADDLLSWLLQAQGEGGGAMSDEQLRDEVMTLLLAGHETTAVSLSWTWYLLAQYPEVEKKLWSELRTVLNGRSPGVQDLPRLPYTERVVKEAMRLYPPAWADCPKFSERLRYRRLSSADRSDCDDEPVDHSPRPPIL